MDCGKISWISSFDSNDLILFVIQYSDPNVDEELPVIYQALILLKTMQRLSQEGIEDLEIAFAERRQRIDKTLLDLFAREKGNGIV